MDGAAVPRNPCMYVRSAPLPLSRLSLALSSMCILVHLLRTCRCVLMHALFDCCLLLSPLVPGRFYDDMAEVDDDDEEDYDDKDRANANELSAMERCVRACAGVSAAPPHG